ncbi:MAG: carboxypeptidase regulatory-like domain-containing protein, partial [bacterium]
VALGALVVPATAQELTSGTIAGKVTDPSGKPIPGAVIIATSQHGTRTTEANANGNYVLPFLRPGAYNVRVEAPGGFNTVIQNDVIVSLNQRTNLNFTLEPGKTETVTVTAASPLVDFKSTSSGTNMNYSEFANAVPLGRSFTDTFAVAPGVVSGLGTGTGNYSISGSSGLENSYLIDGVNITNTGYGGIGSYNIIYGSLGTGVTSEFLDEVQIKTAGFEAEYGQALGGIINTIVKTGTNEFKGNVTWYSSPAGLRSSNQLVEQDTGAANITGEKIDDFAFAVSGPIVKDKLFYFFAYNPVITKRSVRAQSIINPGFEAANAGVVAFDETTANGFDAPTQLAFPSSAFGTLEGERQSNNYAAKITWQASPKHQVEV